jgi:hypothetical protein
VSKSYPEDLNSYLSSRLLTVPMLLLLLLLFLAAWLPSLPTHTSTACIQILIVANLVAMFRLWDDLSDLPKDRTTKPDRILCQTSHEASFRWTCRILGITAFSMLTLTHLLNGIGFALLTAFFTLYYKSPWRTSWPRLSYHLLILKYPCFIALISISQDQPASQLRLMLILMTYLTLCIYEVIHDPELRADAWCRGIAGIELASAAVTAICITNAIL